MFVYLRSIIIYAAETLNYLISLKSTSQFVQFKCLPPLQNAARWYLNYILRCVNEKCIFLLFLDDFFLFNSLMKLFSLYNSKIAFAGVNKKMRQENSFIKIVNFN